MGTIMGTVIGTATSNTLISVSDSDGNRDSKFPST
jgi:hypothetical protein